MARSKHYAAPQTKRLPVHVARQLLPGTCEYTRPSLSDEQTALSVCQVRSRNDPGGAPAAAPALVLQSTWCASLPRQPPEPPARAALPCARRGPGVSGRSHAARHDDGRRGGLAFCRAPHALPHPLAGRRGSRAHRAGEVRHRWGETPRERQPGMERPKDGPVPESADEARGGRASVRAALGPRCACRAGEPQGGGAG